MVRSIRRSRGRWSAGRSRSVSRIRNKPGPRLVQALGRLRIAAARLDDAGRTLVLTTDPHPRQATYVLTVPARRHRGKRGAPGGRPAGL